MSSFKTHNPDKSKLYCGCSKGSNADTGADVLPDPQPSHPSHPLHPYPKELIGGQSNNESNEINKDNLAEHLYPATNDTPFSDLADTPKEPESQAGGASSDTSNILNKDIIGKTLSELIYLRHKTDYMRLLK